MDFIYFLLRYIPFWTVPIVLIAGEFSYIYWLKSFHRLAYILFAIAFFCLILNGFYFWSGGPDKIVIKFNEIISM